MRLRGEGCVGHRSFSLKLSVWVQTGEKRVPGSRTLTCLWEACLVGTGSVTESWSQQPEITRCKKLTAWKSALEKKAACRQPLKILPRGDRQKLCEFYCSCWPKTAFELSAALNKLKPLKKVHWCKEMNEIYDTWKTESFVVKMKGKSFNLMILFS